MSMTGIYLAIPLASLAGAVVAGLFGKQIGRSAAHWVTIAGVGVSCALSWLVFWQIVVQQMPAFNGPVYQWLFSDGVHFEVGFLVDRLTALMMVVVTTVSLMVHIYTIGYMHDDPGYQRFFSYISLFTFSMLMLVMANNFMQLFFGWEAVGLVSYLLIGFWWKRESAIFANLKAFLVNRVGDFGFLLGIAAVLTYTGSLDYAEVFSAAPALEGQTMSIVGGYEWQAITVICVLLFIGAMGKSAQVPLHVWLPDSMEGPTPISALIHAATMVTAGIFMVARMSPLFEMSEAALGFVMIIGAVTAFFLGLIGMVQNDIKRVVAYSTLSQLGYMTAALGASAYAASVFHLMTHAFFKALLFLAAGSVIIAMHHEQDMRKMGGLRKYLPITYATSLIGTLALIGFPGFSGFFSKDSIIEAVSLSQLPLAGITHVLLLGGVFVTAFYSFRLLFMVFHGEPRMDEQTRSHLHEPGKVVTWPLLFLAVPSVFAGVFIDPLVMGDFFHDIIPVLQDHHAIHEMRSEFHGVLGFILHGLTGLPTLLALAGASLAWWLCLHQPQQAGALQQRFSGLHRMLTNKYGIDDFNQRVFAGGARMLGRQFSLVGDRKMIDGWLVNGSASNIGRLSAWMRQLQTGYLYHYSFAMILGLIGLVGWIVVR